MAKIMCLELQTFILSTLFWVSIVNLVFEEVADLSNPFKLDTKTLVECSPWDGFCNYHSFFILRGSGEGLLNVPNVPKCRSEGVWHLPSPDDAFSFNRPFAIFGLCLQLQLLVKAPQNLSQR